MWKDVDVQERMNEPWLPSEPRTSQEIEEIVVAVRLDLYNRDESCGPKAIRTRMDEFYHVRPLPSARTIARILARHGLTYGRTGVYEGV